VSANAVRVGSLLLRAPFWRMLRGLVPEAPARSGSGGGVISRAGW
jgi:hypothetical protein